MKFTAEQLLNILDECYKKALNGVGPLKGAVEIGNEYLEKHNGDKEKAIKDLIKIEQAKCTADGFVTGLGGFATLAVGLPANIASVLLIQARLAISIAHVYGNDVENDLDIKNKVLACIAGLSLKEVAKQTLIKKVGETIVAKAGTEVVKKVALRATEKAIFAKIPYAVGTKLTVKFTTKGISSVTKLIPVLGGVIGGGLDFLSTKAIAQASYRMFVTKEDDITLEEIEKMIQENQNENEMA